MSRRRSLGNTGLRRRKPATVWPRATLNEALAWKAASADGEPSGLVRRARTLDETPIAEFSPADICFLSWPKDRRRILLDRALDRLERAPRLETEFYPGDLRAFSAFPRRPSQGTARGTHGFWRSPTKDSRLARPALNSGNRMLASTSGLSSRMVSTNSTPL